MVYGYCSICKTQLKTTSKKDCLDPYETQWYMEPCPNECVSSKSIVNEQYPDPPTSSCSVCDTQLVVDDTREEDGYEDGCKGIDICVFVHPCEKCCAPE